MKIIVGDWVQFMSGGILVIGKVEHILRNRWSSSDDERFIYTSVGCVVAKYVLERRNGDGVHTRTEE